VLAVTVDCDEKIAETWAIRPDNHNVGDGGSDAGHPSAIAQGKLSQKA
jgi:hypothetical protein